ncbi:MAG: efflux RND transporter periplasmic adaptor subunit [Verrucomicrobia bacterium]|nr:efflux RND transporter periplasmic adaptor subunit [Verrucomicrobiota bacterium]
MKNIIIVALLLAVGVFGYFQWQDGKEQTNSNKAGGKIRKTTEVIENRDIDFTVRVAGEISPADKVSVRPEVHGKIAELPVDISDRVVKGDLLFRLDDKDLKIEIDSRKKQIDSATLQLEQAKSEFERSKQLFEEQLISTEIFERAKTKYEQSLISRDRSQNDYQLSLEKLSKTSVLAPFDCTVLSRPVSIGQAVSGTGGQSSGTEVMEIADLNNLIIQAHVNQADVARMNKEQVVKIEIEAISDLIIDGIVERIAPQATIRNSIKGFSTRIKLLTSDSDIIPGMTASISIPVASADNVVAAPLAAIFTERNETEQRTEIFTYVENGEVFDKTMLDVGVNDLYHTEVLRGLKVGDVVAIEKPDDNKIGETISLDGKVVAKSEPEKNPLLEKYDKNGDGKLDREEMQAAMASMTDEEKKKMREQMMKRSGGRKGGKGGGGSSRRGSKGPR